MNTELSYKAHKENWKSLVLEKEERLYYKNKKDSIQYSVTTRPFSLLKPLLSKKNKWLTIGDYNGLEANFLLTDNQNVFASDIDDTFLKEAHKNNLIKEYGIVNSEKILNFLRFCLVYLASISKLLKICWKSYFVYTL